MDKYSKELLLETDYFNETILEINKQMKYELNKIAEEKGDIISTSKEIWDNAAPSAYDIDSLLEASLYLQSLQMQISNYGTSDSKIHRLQKMLDTPYFARVDFQELNEQREKIYIGLSTLIDDDHNIYVYDWRSPISSIYYGFELGEVYYDAPMGRIKGEVFLKRQYEIENRQLKFFFDSDVQIIDSFLKEILSKNASTKMKSIVETIQRDQDMIIRDMKNDLLFVQGVAGSGKTSVALHRVAYLMYQGLNSPLKAQNIIIVSPNTFFAKYISNVLPDLGEDNVKTVVFEDLLYNAFGKDLRQLQTRNQLLEKLITCNNMKEKNIISNSMKFKTSKTFIKILRNFIKYYERRMIPFIDIYYNNHYIFSKGELKSILLNNTNEKPLGIRLKYLEELILEEIRENRVQRISKLENFIGSYPEFIFEIKEMARMISIKESGVLYNNIQDFVKIDYMKLYKELFKNKELFYKLGKGLELPDNIEDIIDYTMENLNSTTSMYEDTLATLFIQIEVEGSREYGDIKQIVIDEAQDYYPIHFEILKSLFYNAKYTVLGDINQTVEKQENISFYDNIQSILQKEKSTLVFMNKSFRCTNEIIEFSSRFIYEDNNLESFNRNGSAPEVIGAKSLKVYKSNLIEEIDKCKSLGYYSIGILCKSIEEAKSLYERLKDKVEINLLYEDSNADIAGVFITPIYMAKGLEFDAIIITGVDEKNYHTNEDKNLLYIGCTRALHRLSLFYLGTKSKLL